MLNAYGMSRSPCSCLCQQLELQDCRLSRYCYPKSQRGALTSLEKTVLASQHISILTAAAANAASHLRGTRQVPSLPTDTGVLLPARPCSLGCVPQASRLCHTPMCCPSGFPTSAVTAGKILQVNNSPPKYSSEWSNLKSEFSTKSVTSCA